LREHRWWLIGEIRASEDVFYPIGLADLLTPIIAGAIPRDLIRIP
jgi:hypothetical protein